MGVWARAHQRAEPRADSWLSRAVLCCAGVRFAHCLGTVFFINTLIIFIKTPAPRASRPGFSSGRQLPPPLNQPRGGAAGRLPPHGASRRDWLRREGAGLPWTNPSPPPEGGGGGVSAEWFGPAAPPPPSCSPGASPGPRPGLYQRPRALRQDPAGCPAHCLMAETAFRRRYHRQSARWGISSPPSYSERTDLFFHIASALPARSHLSSSSGV